MALVVVKTYSRVLVGRHLFGMFPVQNGLKNSTCFNAMAFQLCCSLCHWEGSQNGLKLNGTHQFQPHLHYNNILCGSLHAVKGNRNLVVVSKGMSLEINADRTKYMVMSRYRNAGRGHDIDNSSFERAEDFKYLGTYLPYQNVIQEEIRSRLKSGNACYHSVQNLLSSILLSKNMRTEIYKTLPVVLHGCETTFPN